MLLRCVAVHSINILVAGITTVCPHQPSSCQLKVNPTSYDFSINVQEILLYSYRLISIQRTKVKEQVNADRVMSLIDCYNAVTKLQK